MLAFLEKFLEDFTCALALLHGARRGLVRAEAACDHQYYMRITPHPNRYHPSSWIHGIMSRFEKTLAREGHNTPTCRPQASAGDALAILRDGARAAGHAQAALRLAASH